MKNPRFGTILLLVGLGSVSAHGGTKLRDISFSDVEIPPPAGVELSRDGGSVQLRHTAARPTHVMLVEIASPGIGTPRFALEGEVRHDDVADGSYLEMWTVFADGGRFFTRGLQTRGPLRELAGSSAWRKFKLPMYMDDRTDGAQPSALELAVVLTGPGSVELRDVTLVAYGSDDNPLPVGSSWLSSPSVTIAAALCAIVLVALMLLGFVFLRRAAKTSEQPPGG